MTPAQAGVFFLSNLGAGSPAPFLWALQTRHEALVSPYAQCGTARAHRAGDPRRPALGLAHDPLRNTPAVHRHHSQVGMPPLYR